MFWSRSKDSDSATTPSSASGASTAAPQASVTPDTHLNTPSAAGPSQSTQGDDEEDPYDARIRRSGCQREHEVLQDCYHEKHDWRQCIKEMQAFKACWRATHPGEMQ
ncbi:hypothetical protein AMAG_00514 [Allomyces macrogynus ATCC 38327]|uniref:CHCH domain-containing protein n=1 Tax=Allomyces macrogynus (strain ATCC 38327) TaxID=578462 RepID=A0A0L0RWR3_ALLM3|nr:hypothetical protein AMAG_00514 [Allomyces macrogynus ATCC 38327]|eukprot:KNE54544.1 hypothetical protein AMAG_00514 [Allomyces macrogynus ATCC 38327]